MHEIIIGNWFLIIRNEAIKSNKYNLSEFSRTQTVAWRSFI